MWQSHQSANARLSIERGSQTNQKGFPFIKVFPLLTSCVLGSWRRERKSEIITERYWQNNRLNRLRARLVLFGLEEREQRHTGDLNNLEANTWNITDGVTRSTETGD